MYTSLVQTVAPAVEPISLAEAKSYLRSENEIDDWWISHHIAGARTIAEEITGRQLIAATWRLRMSEFPGRIILPKPKLIAVSSVEYVDGDGVTQSFSGFQVSDGVPAILMPAYGQEWPTTRTDTIAAVSVTYTSGYGAAASAVPGGLKIAMLMLMRYWFDRRDELADSTMQPVPAAVRAILQQYEVGWREYVQE